MWSLYELLLLLGMTLYLPTALWRKRLPHAGWTMRLGRYPQDVAAALPGRSAIWVQAVSVGEVLAVQPLLRALREAVPEAPIVLSTTTPGGFAVASAQRRDRVTPVYFPLDFRGCVARALRVFRPRMILLVESEIWPMLIRLAHAQGVPVIVVNGRMSSRAFRRYRLFRPFLKRTLNRITMCLMQSQADEDRLLQLRVPRARVRVVGSLKWDASIGRRPSPQDVRETAGRLGLGPQDIVIVAGSTHRGEEAFVLQAFAAARTSHPEARLILAPRHLERLAEVVGLIREAGWRLVRLSQDGPTAPWDVALVETFGQLPQYYALATAVFIGGSLIPHGGQNPLEATSLGMPVVFGPSMHNFDAIAHQLLAHHAARQVERGEELSAVLQEWLTDPAQADAVGRRAQDITERFQGATGRTLDALRPFLTRPSSRP